MTTVGYAGSQLDLEALKGHQRDAFGKVMCDDNGNPVRNLAAKFDLNRPPTLPLEFQPFPKAVYKLPENLTLPAEMKVVKDAKEERQALANGWVSQPHVIQPICRSVREYEGIEVECQWHCGHPGKHRHGRYVWADPLLDSEQKEERVYVK